MYQIFLYPRNVRHFHHPVSKYEIPIRLIDWLIDRLLLCLLCICLLVMNRPPKWSAVPAEESPEKLLRDADRVSAGALSYSFLFVSQFLSFFSFLLSFFFFLWLDFFFFCIMQQQRRYIRRIYFRCLKRGGKERKSRFSYLFRIIAQRLAVEIIPYRSRAGF